MPVVRRPTDRFWPALRDYLKRDLRLELRGWWRLARYYGLGLPLTLIALIAGLIHLDPLPPPKAYLATGQRGSASYLLAAKFAQFFKEYGVTLELVPTKGLDEGLHELVDDTARVDASFITAGTSKPDEYPGMVSLGSLRYSPVWLFYRGVPPPPDHPLGELLHRRIAVGMQGTNTRQFLTRMLALHGESLPGSPNVFEIPHEEAADRFARGELDAVFIVDGIDSPTVQRLLQVPDRQIVDFQLAPAYIKKMPFLEKVTIPRGAIDLARIYPPQDLSLLATSVTLVVEKKTHPALQWLYLRAAESISRNRNDFFAKSGHFPEYVDSSVPLSKVGERYFSGGLPTVFKYLPNTLASLIDGTWGTLFAVLVVVWPLMMQIASLRNYPVAKHLQKYWETVGHLEKDLAQIESVADAQVILDQLDELNLKLRDTWVDGEQQDSYHNLCNALTAVREQALRQQAVHAASSPNGA